MTGYLFCVTKSCHPGFRGEYSPLSHPTGSGPEGGQEQDKSGAQERRKAKQEEADSIAMAKTTVIHVRVSEDDLKVMDRAAEQAGLDRSKLIRRAIRNYNGEPYFTEKDEALLREIIAELVAQGRNLMMAVRQMNRMLKGGDPQADTRDHYSKDDFAKLHGIVDKLLVSLRDAVHRRAAMEKKP